MHQPLAILFKEFVEKSKLFDTNDKLLLAFSGGIDSVVLAHLLLINNYHFELAHCNFQLRSSESNRDEQFAFAFAKKNNLVIHSQRFETKTFAKEQKITIQEAARILRYRYFNDIATQQQCSFILTAHHLDDSIETIFLNLIRGTGIKGICGIPTQNNNIIRPLIFATRKEIELYALTNNLSWTEDSSNQSDKYKRNQIRHHLIPIIKEQNISFYTIFKENIQRFSNSVQLLEALVNEKMASIIETKNEQIIIKLNKLKQFPQFTSLLYHFAQNYGFNYDQIKSITEQTHQSGKTFNSTNYQAYIDRETMVILPRKKNIPSNEIEITSNTKQINDPISLTFKNINYQKHKQQPNNSNIALIDATQIHFPLILRKWKPGDRFRPLGMKHFKKISDFLTDLKTPRYLKDNVWVLTSNKQIIWVVGYRIDERFKITDKTKKALQIQLKK